ncbi:membrane protein insertion efficiency factor YidD [bacterium]|nr:MAG: membrane protein insertion efficiency factor YidD [bacterium]
MSERSSSGLGLVSRVGNWPFLLVIYAYRVTLSPIMGGQCRFEPTCSRYGIEAYKSYGPIRGTMMTGKRILRCNPFSKGGYDPVPIRSCGHEQTAASVTDLHNESKNERERD